MTQEEQITFKDLGLSKETLAAIEKKGFKTPSPIQAQTIPLMLQGDKDIIGQSQTGTGKTASFGLPIIEKVDPKSKKTQCLILAPTRELAMQVCEELKTYKGKKQIYIEPVYGGASITTQLSALRRGVQIVVGTPGRVIDHIKRGSLKLNDIKYMVLDEADEMLNMGFLPDIKDILSKLNDDKQTIMFSATMPKEILGIAKKFMGDYDIVRIEKKDIVTKTIDQFYYEVNRRTRFSVLCRILDIELSLYGIIFCKTKRETDELSNKLSELGYKVDALHGDISQAQREKILAKFRKKQLRILVATDVAARGIDVKDISHVINYSLPQSCENYVHRIGRTGRAGEQGTAISLIGPHENRDLRKIMKINSTTIRKEKLPSVEKLLEVKKLGIINEVKSILDHKIDESYSEIAETLLEETDAKKVIQALLKYTFKHSLDAKKYDNINANSQGFSGSLKLFVAKGKKDSFGKRDIVDMITKKSGINGNSIVDIKILDLFSFVNIKERDAKKVLNAFKKGGSRRRPMVELADKKNR